MRKTMVKKDGLNTKAMLEMRHDIRIIDAQLKYITAEFDGAHGRSHTYSKKIRTIKRKLETFLEELENAV